MRPVAASLALAALAGCTTTLTAPRADPLPPGSHYVAMGSSFAAGPGIGPMKPGTPERCTRAQNNYASQLAARLSLDLSDASCSGATTAHLLSAWDELPAQLDAVTPDTRLVTITVGGNDVNYMGLLFTASCDPAAGDCAPRVHLPTEQAYADLRTRMVAIVESIRARAPRAQVVFVQYVTLVPEAPCAATPIDAVAVREAHELASRLAETTRQAAAQTGALVLPAEGLSEGHTPCGARPWSRGFPAPAGAVPWHPTAAGHAAIADELAAMLDG